MSPIHRTGDDDRIAGASWESLTERLIREAQDRGDFDDLPFRGERIPLEDDSAAGDLALGFHVLRNAGIAPPWIEADKEVRRLLGKRDALLDRARREGRVSDRLRREFEALIATANRSIDVLNWGAPTHGAQRRRLDLIGELRSLEEAAGAD